MSEKLVRSTRLQMNALISEFFLLILGVFLMVLILFERLTFASHATEILGMFGGIIGAIAYVAKSFADKEEPVNGKH